MTFLTTPRSPQRTEPSEGRIDIFHPVTIISIRDSSFAMGSRTLESSRDSRRSFFELFRTGDETTRSICSVFPLSTTLERFEDLESIIRTLFEYSNVCIVSAPILYPIGSIGVTRRGRRVWFFKFLVVVQILLTILCATLLFSIYNCTQKLGQTQFCLESI